MRFAGNILVLWCLIWTAAPSAGHVPLPDAMGRLDQKKKNGSVWVDIDYTPSGQRSRMQDNLDGEARLTRYVYDDLDRLAIKSTPQGTLSYEYDTAQNLKTISAQKAYTIPADPPYDLGTIQASATVANPGGALMSYGYDERHRLAFVNKDPAGENADAAYSYDPVGNLAALKYRNGVQTACGYNF